jgi:hypothetical protein
MYAERLSPQSSLNRRSSMAVGPESVRISATSPCFSLVDVGRSVPNATGLFKPLGQQQKQLLVGKSLERSNWKVHRDLAPIFTLKRDRHARGLEPAIRQTIAPRAFERTPINPCAISETTHSRHPSGSSASQRGLPATGPLPTRTPAWIESQSVPLAPVELDRSCR